MQDLTTLETLSLLMPIYLGLAAMFILGFMVGIYVGIHHVTILPPKLNDTTT